MRQAAERAATESLASASNIHADWDFAPPEEPGTEAPRTLPAFQAVERSPRTLLNPVDRMVSVAECRACIVVCVISCVWRDHSAGNLGECEACRKTTAATAA